MKCTIDIVVHMCHDYRNRKRFDKAVAKQVVQLSQRDRAAGSVRFGRNISDIPLAASVIVEHRIGYTRYREGACHQCTYSQ